MSTHARIFQAIRLAALLSLIGCGSVPEASPFEDRLQRHASAGAVAISTLSAEEAIEHYRLAVKYAWATDDPLAIAQNAYNLAASLAIVGQEAAALDWLQEARAEFCRAGHDDTLVTLMEARIAREQCAFSRSGQTLDVLCRRLEDAPMTVPAIITGPIGHVRNSVHGLWDSVRPAPNPYDPSVLHAQVHLERAHLALDLCDPRRAAKELALADELLETCHCDKSTAIRAEWLGVRGELFLLQGKPLAAAEAFREQADLLRSIGNYRTMALAYVRAAEAYETAAEPALAAEFYFRAARNLYGRGQVVESLRLIQRALPMVEHLTNRPIARRFAVLFAEVSCSVAELKQSAAAEEPLHRDKPVPDKSSPDEPPDPPTPPLPAPPLESTPDPVPLEDPAPKGPALSLEPLESIDAPAP